MAIIASYPTSYFHANHSGVYTDIVTGGGNFKLPPDWLGNDTANANVLWPGLMLFWPWMGDLTEIMPQNAVIFIVNNTGSPLHMGVLPYYDGGTLISQPILPDNTVATIPAGYTTDNGTYLGMGRFVQGQGSGFYGSGIALTLTIQVGAGSQDFGIFVAASVNPGSDTGYGLDVCSNMAGVDPKTRFDAVAGLQNTPIGGMCADQTSALKVQAVICNWNAFSTDDDLTGVASPLVFVLVSG